VQHVRKDGTRFWSHVAIASFVHSSHGPVWVNVHRDVTERKRAEQQARERQEELTHVARVNTVGELAATLAHELTQPVMAIEHFNHAAMGVLENGAEGRERALQLLRATDQQVKRAAEVIRHLRKFVRRGAVEKKPVSLPRVIEEALVLLRAMFVDHGVDVHLECAAALPPVDADAVQIEQVLVNLMRNSVEAMTAADRPPFRIEVACRQHGTMLEVTVRDNGPGLNSAQQASLFNVFESEKEGGMGLGLAISRSIVQAHGGELWADPATGRGAAFRFTLPIAGSKEGTP
jgi:two-component system sensor kinase FixL